MRVAIYSRKSVCTGKGESIENQIEMCRQYIAANLDGVTENDIAVFEDEGFSAKNMARPQFQKMLKEIKEKNFEHLVCYRLDRISRNVGDFARLIEELNNIEIGFHCIKEKFDTTTPMGKAMMFIASVFAQLERETLAERVRDNMFMLARAGRWLGGTPPTGFLAEKTEKIDVDGKVKTACKLKFDPAGIEAVKIMCRKFQESHSVSGVYKHLIDVGIKSKSGKWFSPIGIKQILENPVYCVADKAVREFFVLQGSDVCFGEEDCSDELGLLSYNKRDCKKKNAPRQEKSEWIIAIGKHKGIITGNEWVAIQNIFAAKKPSGPKLNTRNDYSLLSGSILCQKCGRRMFARLRQNKGKGSLYDYICDGKLKGGTKVCACQNLNGQQTDDLVSGYLRQYTKERAAVHPLLAKLTKLKTDLAKEEKSSPLLELDAGIKKCTADMASFVHKLAQPGVGQVLLRQVNVKVEELAAELERLNAEKKRLQEKISLLPDPKMQLESIAHTLSSLKTCFSEMTIQEKRAFINLLAQKIEWDGEDVHIFICG